MGQLLESRVGKICIALYALFAIAMYVVSWTCGSGACGLAIVLPIMPWAYLLTEELGISFSTILYPFLILVNVSVVYVAGALLELAFFRFLDRRSASGRDV